MHAGVPCRVMKNVTVKVRLDKDDVAAVKQDIGGWVCMPPDQFEKLLEAATR